MWTGIILRIYYWDKKKKKNQLVSNIPREGNQYKSSSSFLYSERNALAPQLVLGKLRNMPVTSLRAVFLS